MLGLLISCGDGGDTGDLECREPPLSWDNFGQGLMSRHCTGCHSSLLPEDMRGEAPLGVDLETEEGFLDWADRVEVRATGSEPTMPPGGGPTEVEVVQLEEYLRCVVQP
jgi:uncharacterized membrane protein